MQLFGTIRGRLYLLALLALAPLLAMLVHAGFAVQRVREESEITANVELARASASAFAAFVRDVSRTALPLGEALAGGQLSPAEASVLLSKTAGAYAAVRELSWVSPAGEIVISSNPAARGVEVADRVYFLRILAGDDEAVSDLIEPRTGGLPSFVIARAVRHPGGRLAGVVLALIAPERLYERPLAMARVGDAALSLVDTSGRVVFRSPELALGWDERQLRDDELVRRALRGEEASGSFAGLRDDERLGAAVPVPGIGWVARATRDARDAFGPVRRELARSGLLALIAAAASLGAFALVGKRLTGALRVLEDQAEALGRGESEPRAASSPPPEIARLSDAYARMAERLRLSREALRVAFESAPAGILLVDGDTLRARWANRAYLELLDEPHRGRGIAGAALEEFMPGAEALGILHGLGRVASGALPHLDAEYRLDRNGLAPGWWRWSVRSIPSTERLGARDLLVVATDVTDQVIARRRAEDDRQRLEAVLDALPIGVLITDRAGKLVEANPAARTIWGGELPHEPASYPGWWTASGERLRPDEWAVSRALARGEISVGEMIDIERFDGRRATILNNAVPIRGGSGAVVGAVVAMQDVSELRRAQRRERTLLDAGAVLGETLELDDAARRLARFAVPLVADLCLVDEVLPDGALRLVAVAHADPEREEWVRAALAQAPLDRRALARRAAAERLTVHVPDVAEAMASTPGEEHEHLAILRAAGVESWIAVPLLASGGVIAVLTLATTSSGRRLDEEDVHLAEELGWRAAQALDNARLFREVRRAVRSRDEVLSVVSHDLRNPLGVVTLGARIIAELPESPAALERARTSGRRILAAGERMARLIGDLLDIAGLQEGRLAIERSAWPPVELLREALEESKGPAQARGLELRCEAQPRLPEVACDRGRVLQILGNLLANAIKATERGWVALSAAAGDGEVVFSVTDTGPGIPEDEQSRLFERFSRGAGARYDGSGLGLAISRALVEAQGGRIWVESRPGQGAAFRFSLPAASGGRGGGAPGSEGQVDGAGGAEGGPLAAAGAR